MPVAKGRTSRPLASARPNIAAGASATPCPAMAASTISTELSNTMPRNGGQGAPAAANQRGHSSAR